MTTMGVDMNTGVAPERCTCYLIHAATWQDPAEWEQDVTCPVHHLDPFTLAQHVLDNPVAALIPNGSPDEPADTPHSTVAEMRRLVVLLAEAVVELSQPRPLPPPTELPPPTGPMVPFGRVTWSPEDGYRWWP